MEKVPADLLACPFPLFLFSTSGQEETSSACAKEAVVESKNAALKKKEEITKRLFLVKRAVFVLVFIGKFGSE